MTVTLVLRLVDEALASGELRGEVEEIRSGERRRVRDGAELLAFALNVSGAGVTVAPHDEGGTT
jgi:hypothetical protein